MSISAPGPTPWPRFSPADRASPRRCGRPSVPLSSSGRAPPAARTALRSCRWRRSSRESVGAVTEGWNGFSVLHTAASRVGALDLGFVPGEGGLTAARDGAGRASTFCSTSARTRSRSRPVPSWSIRAPTATEGAHRADVILPGAAYTEKSGTYVNTGGSGAAGQPRRLRAGRCPRGLGDPAGALGRARPPAALRLAGRLRQALYADHPHFAALDRIAASDAAGAVRALAGLGGPSRRRDAFVGPIGDFYLTNPIARASGVMAECSALARGARARGGGVRDPDAWISATSSSRWRSWWARACSCSSLSWSSSPMRSRRPQDLGGGAAAARPERGRPVGAAPELRRPAEVRAQGAGHPGRGQQGHVPAGAARDRAPWRSPPGR